MKVECMFFRLDVPSSTETTTKIASLNPIWNLLTAHKAILLLEVEKRWEERAVKSDH